MSISLTVLGADSQIGTFNIDEPLSGMKSDDLIKLIKDLKDMAI